MVIRRKFLYLVLSVFSFVGVLIPLPGFAELSSNSTQLDIQAVRAVIYQSLLNEPALNSQLATVGESVYFDRSGAYALGTWIVGELGGVDILRREGNSWIDLCGTGGIFSAEEAALACAIPLDTAQDLLRQVP